MKDLWVDQVEDEEVEESKVSKKPPVGFALICPPGHHPIVEGALEFCIFGNVAVAARYAQRVHGLKCVFIIDFDVHHGNGTNDVFYDDPDIFFLSTHQMVASLVPTKWMILDVGVVKEQQLNYHYQKVRVMQI